MLQKCPFYHENLGFHAHFWDFPYPIVFFSANFQRNVIFFEDSENLEARLENASTPNCFLFSQLCVFFSARKINVVTTNLYS